MEFKTDDWGGVRFVVPDEPNILQLTRCDSVRYERDRGNSILLLWEMAKTLIGEWECEALPDMQADLSKVTDSRVARILEWVGVTTSAYRRSLDTISKNS